MCGTRSALPRRFMASLAATLVVSISAVGWTASSAAPLPTVTAIAAAGHHSCAIVDGGAMCWGWNAFGQLGDGSNADSPVPVDVSGLSTNVAAISGGADHTCALTASGAAKCWGYDSHGELGDGGSSDRSTPIGVTGLSSGVQKISAGDFHTCVVTSAGGVKCWGFGLEGQLGDGATTSRATPVAVSGLSSGVAAVAAGGHHTCALMASGSVKCWGYNAFGQLGDGTTTDRTTPVSVSGLPGAATALSAGADHTCALLGTGGVTCWGFNVSGQLGDGSRTSRPTPAAVSGLSSGVTEISAGADHTCAVGAGGLAKCWGSNGLGRLGDGSTTDRRTPVAVLGLSAASAVSGGADHTCAVTSGGSARCWGGNALGQVGDGTTDARTTAVGVVGLAGDERPPSVSLVLTDPNGGVPDGANGWFVHGPVSGTVTADESANGGSDITAIDCAGATVEASVGLGTPTASASFSIVSEGRRSVTCTATDAAGNTSDPTVLSVNLDVTPPSVLVAVVPRLIFLHGTATRSADATDNIGPVTRHCLYRFDADSVGRKAFTCEARDEAGNVATSTVYYVVRYRLLSFAPPEGSRFRVGSKVRIFVALGGNTGIKIRNALASAIVSECAVTVTFRGLPPANHCVRYAPIARVFKATFATGPALRRGAHTIILAIALPGDVVQRATRTVIMTS